MESTLDYNVRLAELQQTASGLAARTLGQHRPGNYRWGVGTNGLKAVPSHFGMLYLSVKVDFFKEILNKDDIHGQNEFFIC